MCWTGTSAGIHVCDSLTRNRSEMDARRHSQQSQSEFNSATATQDRRDRCVYHRLESATAIGGDSKPESERETCFCRLAMMLLIKLKLTILSCIKNAWRMAYCSYSVALSEKLSWQNGRLVTAVPC